MKKPLAAAAAVAGLVLAPGALAANTGSISVTHTPMVLAGSSSTTIHVAIPQATDPIAAINIYVPSGYTLNTSQAPGTTIGSVDATAFSQDAGLTLPLSGNVTTASPASVAAQSAQCTGSPASQAVWILNLSVAGQTIQLPLFVNPTAGAETALGATKLTICLPPPDVPVGTPGRSAQGAQVLDARFSVEGVFTTPTAAALLRWDALFTPYTPKTGVVNRAGTFEARAFVPLPVALGIGAKYIAKTNTFQLAGKVSEGGLPVPNLTVHIARGTSAARLTQQSSTTTAASGSWQTAGHLKPRKTTYFRINATVAEHDFAAGCQSPATAVAPAGCVSAKLSAWSAKSAVLRLVVKAPKKHK